jgi:fibronectin-binding autotransporter adhesin
MKEIRTFRQFGRTIAISTFAVAFGLAATHVNAATVYFDVNGATAGSGVTDGGSYSWEDADWSSSSGGTVATANYVDGDFPRFSAGTDAAGKTYTVTASANHTFAGMFANSNAAGNVHLATTGGGVLSITPGAQGFFSGTNSNLYIDAPLAGVDATSRLQWSGGGGSLYLYAANTFQGGVQLNSVNGLNFNNNNSFGTGTISWRGLNGTGSGTSVLATPDATAPITIANAVEAAANTQIFVGLPAAPVTFSGPWTLPASGTTTFQNQPAGTTVTISGAISGAANFTKTGAGTLVLSGANAYSGNTTASAGIVTLGAAGTIASSSSLVLNGGTVNPDGLNQIMSATTLNLLANSTLDFIAGASEMDFANSSALAWTGTILNLASWNPSIDKLRFGTNATGLTSAQLATIEFNGGGLGTAQLDANGYVVIPEPSTVVLILLGLTVLPGRRRTS